MAAARREAAPRHGRRRSSPACASWPCPRPGSPIDVGGDGPADQVTFLLGANAGEPLQPLAKAASGGELARTMLAIRLATTDSQGVMVFDEVDAGVGGAAATAVGSALADLGRHAQVLVVTHLAQVAAQADQQVEVRKSERAGRTRTEVDVLDTTARVVELSRMLSGSPDSASAQRHARELLQKKPTPVAPGRAGGWQWIRRRCWGPHRRPVGSASLIRCPTWMARRNPSGDNRGPVHPRDRVRKPTGRRSVVSARPSSSSSPVVCRPRWARASPPRHWAGSSSAAVSG